MNTIRMFRFRSLNSKLIALYLPLVSLSLIGLLSVLEIRHFRIHQTELKSDLQQLISIHETVLTRAVREHDFDRIGRLLKSIAIDPNFRGAIVYDSLGKILTETGDIDLRTADPEYSSDTELNYESQLHSEPVGRLVLIFHKGELYRQLTERLVIDGLILAVLVTTVLAITLLVMRRLIIIPIRHLQAAIQKMREANIREPVQWDTDDELGQLVHAYNDMQANQTVAESKLREYRQHLEDLVSEDAEELQKNRRLLAAIVDNNSALIHVKQADGRYLMVNRAWCGLFDFESQEVIGKTDHEIFPEETANRYRDSDLLVLRTGQPVSEEEPIHRSDVEQTLVSLKLPLFDSQGSGYATCGIASDITERKKLEEELIIAKESAEEANRSKNDFLSTLSHEISTPMNEIIGFTARALKTDLSEKQRNLMNNIRITADALLTLINELLDYSKIEAGKLDIETTAFEPGKDPGPSTDPTGHRFRVNKFLIVDDNPMSLRVLLEELGFACLAATSGEQALEILEHQETGSPVDAVLLDWKLPGIDGIETARKIRSMDSGGDVPIVMISPAGHDFENLARDKVGLNAILNKPIRRSTLFDTLVNLFSERRHATSIGPESSERFGPTGQLSGTSPPLAEDRPPLLESLAGFDPREGIERLGNKPELYTKLLKTFVESTTNTGNQVRNQLSTGNLKGAYHLLHTLKGIAGNLAATRLLAATLELEATTRARMSGNPASTQVEQQYLDNFLKVLEATRYDVKRCLPPEKPPIPATGDPRDKGLSEQSAKETAHRIRDATFMGDLSELQSIAESLPADSYWALEVFRLTDNLDFDGLEKLAYALDNLY